MIIYFLIWADNRLRTLEECTHFLKPPVLKNMQSIREQMFVASLLTYEVQLFWEKSPFGFRTSWKTSEIMLKSIDITSTKKYLRLSFENNENWETCTIRKWGSHFVIASWEKKGSSDYIFDGYMCTYACRKRWEGASHFKYAVTLHTGLAMHLRNQGEGK